MSAVAIGAAGLFAIASQAQEAAETGLAVTLDVDQRFEIDTNNGLASGGEETTRFSSTNLTLGISTETPLSSFSLITSGALRILNGPDDPDTEIGFEDPAVRLAFSRDTGNAEVNFTSRYKRSDVDFTRPLSDFADPDTGEIILPDDLGDLQGAGTRTRASFNGSVELFKNSPTGLTLSAGHSSLRYSGTVDPDLFPTDRFNADADVRFTFSPVLEGMLSLSHSTFDAEDVDLTENDTQSVSFGLTYDVSPVLQTMGTIGYSVSDEDEGIGIARTRTRNDGIIGSFGVTRELSNGSIGSSVDTNTGPNGRRNSINLDRFFELPTGSLSSTLGLTRGSANKTNVIGNLTWNKELPTGVITAQLNRSISADNEDDDQLRTALSTNYSHTINELSSIDLHVSFATTDAPAGGDKTNRLNASTTYNYAVTEDWSLSTGYTYRQRDTDASASADSHSIFFGIGRRFNLRP